jgi:hypothetical protein
MAARLAARSGRGVDVGADEWSTARGGTARGALRGKRGGGDETGTVASGGAPLVASGTRVRRGMGGGGFQSARGHVKEEEGVWPQRALELGALNTSTCGRAAC